MSEPAVIMAQSIPVASELSSPTAATTFTDAADNAATPATATTSSSSSSSKHAPNSTSSSNSAESSTAGTKKSRKPYTITKPRESWTKEEHNQFLDALKLYERDWKQIGQLIPTKSIIQIRSHAQKYFIKMNKMGLKEHIPPPRPKKRSKRPYPKSREGGRSGRRSRGEGDGGDDNSGSGSGSEDSESGSGSSSSGSESEDDEDESESKQQQQQQRETRVKRENGQQREEESKQHRSPVKRGMRAGSAGLAMSDVDEAMNGTGRAVKQERRKKESDRPAKRRSTSKNRKRGSDDEQNGSGSDRSSAAESSDDNNSASNNKSNNKPTKRRRTTGTSSLASLPSPAAFNHTLPTLPSLPLHDLPSSSVYGPAWMESDAAIEFDHSGSAAMQQSSRASLSDEDEGVAPLPLRLHHHSHHHRSSSSSQMSHFAALSQLSPVSQLSQAADLVGGQEVDDNMQLGGRVDEVGGEQSEGEVMGMYGPFPEDFVYPSAAPPPPPAPPVYGPFQPNRRSPLHPAARHMSRHRASSSATSSSSTTTANKPEFSKVYAFLGSLFDPSTSGHTEDLEAMTPSNREMVKALMHNLARNLTSSGAAGVAGVGGGSTDLGEVSTVPSPMPLSFSPAPDVFTADSPAHRFTSSASAPSFFSTPATTHKPTTPPPSSAVGPSSALFTPSSALPTRSTTHISTPSDFFHSAITSHTTAPLSSASSVASTPLPASDGEGRGGLSGLTLNLSPSGGLSTGGLDSPGGPQLVLFSPLGGASVGETSIGGQ